MLIVVNLHFPPEFTPIRRLESSAHELITAAVELLRFVTLDVILQLFNRYFAFGIK